MFSLRKTNSNWLRVAKLQDPRDRRCLAVLQDYCAAIVSRHSFTSLHDLYVQLFSYLMPIGQQPGIFRPTSNLQFMAQSNYSNIVTAGFWWLINPTWGWTSTYYTISFVNEHPVSSYLIGYWSGCRGAITPTYNIQPMSLLKPGSNPKLGVCNFSDMVSAPYSNV